MIFLAGLEVHERQKGGPLFPHPKAIGVGYSPAFDETQETRSKIVAHKRGEGFILVAATEGAVTPTVAYRHTDRTRANDYSSVYAVRSVWFHHRKGAAPVWFHLKGATPMDVHRILSELRTERELVVDAILHLG